MKALKWIIPVLLLAGGAVLCIFRWQAWFGMPAEPTYIGDTLQVQFRCFGNDSVPGFVPTEDGWQDINEPDVLRFIVFGDVHNQMDSADYATLLQRHGNVDFYAQLGDWMERCYFYYEQHLYHAIQGSGLDTLPIINCPGNHEYIKGLKVTLPERWLTMFHHPMNGPARFAGSTYYVDFPRLRIISLDTQGLQRLSDFTIVHGWLKKALKTADGRFTVIIMHHPIYSSGKGRMNVGIWMTFHSLLRNNVDLVFAGHDHGHDRKGHFINTNSSRKTYKQKGRHIIEIDPKQECRLYEVVEIKGDTFRVETWSLDSLNYIDTFQVAPLVQDSTAIAG
ncbi:MAG: metallophosphoesterase [Paludibacteraceae bacterium]|nr:metallophosphoesterase [Paludibacteraceae bacterium]